MTTPLVQKKVHMLFSAFVKTEIYILAVTGLTGIFAFIAYESIFIGIRLFAALNLVLQPIIVYVYRKSILSWLHSRK